MRATQSLPDTYRKIGAIDVSKSESLLLLLNLIGLAAMVGFGYLFIKALLWMRPEEGVRTLRLLQIASFSGWLVVAAAVIGLTVFHVVLHEAIHGIFFWIFTRARPRFAFRWAYAYASAPDWYIPRDPFLITTLAPFVFISLAGLVILGTAPTNWLLPTWFVITMNAGGAVGDLIVAGWLVRQPPVCLAQDKGDAVTLYLPK